MFVLGLVWQLQLLIAAAGTLAIGGTIHVVAAVDCQEIAAAGHVAAAGGAMVAAGSCDGDGVTWGRYCSMRARRMPLGRSPEIADIVL